MRCKVQGDITFNQIEQAILVSAAFISPFDSVFDHYGYAIDSNY